MDATATKTNFIKSYREHIHRSGSEDLLYYLMNQSNFLKDPASTKYHLSCPGGLALHSLHVFYRLQWLVRQESGWSETHDSEFRCPSEESVAIVALLHDLCKADTYVPLLSPDSNLSSYRKEDLFPFGHGEKSVYIISKFMQLTDEEALAIRYHMSSWNAAEGDTAGRVYEQNLLAFLLHVADEYATFIDEVKQ